MKSTDPASLQNLNDVVLPADVSWWPLATGWYFLSGALLILFGWVCYRSLRRWWNNRYRRAALCELQLLVDNIQNEESRASSLRQIPMLLKRTALSVYPRNQVASLAGKDWHNFLNSGLKNPVFTESIGDTLQAVSYSVGDLSSVDTPAAAALLDASQHWLKHHLVTSVSKDSKDS
jgi:hypothetical protein